MEEIKVGEYVRTMNGNIFKILGGNSDNYDIDIDYYKLENTEEDWFESNRYNDNGYFFDKKHIVKHSPNIIDLIEVSDYVNGKLIHKVDIRENSAYIYYGNCKTFADYQIHDIVTKEQFESIKYEA